MKLYAWIIALTLVMLSVKAFASVPAAAPQPCVEVAMASASDIAGGQATKATFSHSLEIDKGVSEHVYIIEVVGGQNGEVQQVATPVQVFERDGVSYCG